MTGQVIQYPPETWKAMLMVKESIRWYEEQPETDLLGSGKRKEKGTLKELLKDRVVH